MNARLTTQRLDSYANSSFDVLDRMAWTIDRDGIDSIPPAALRELGFEARTAGVRPSLADLLVDTSAPSVVRNRVFGVIAGALRRHRQGTPVLTPDQVTCAA